MESVRAAFVERRLRLGLTQEAAAAAAGLSRKTVSDFENGRPAMTLRNLVRLLAVVGLELATREAGARPTLDEVVQRYGDEEPSAPPRRRVRRRKA